MKELSEVRKREDCTCENCNSQEILKHFEECQKCHSRCFHNTIVKRRETLKEMKCDYCGEVIEGEIHSKESNQDGPIEPLYCSELCYGKGNNQE